MLKNASLLPAPVYALSLLFLSQSHPQTLIFHLQILCSILLLRGPIFELPHPPLSFTPSHPHQRQILAYFQTPISGATKTHTKVWRRHCAGRGAEGRVRRDWQRLLPSWVGVLNPMSQFGLGRRTAQQKGRRRSFLLTRT